jgi:hypothetical protein
MHYYNDFKRIPEHRQDETTKLWYNKYLYKSIYILPGVYVLRTNYSSSDIKTHIQEFKSSSWRATLLKNIIGKYDENEKEILHIAKILEPYRYDKTVLLRVAEPSVSIFTNKLDLHENLIYLFNEFLHVDCRPQIDAIPFLLNSKDSIIVKDLPYNRYRYKVIMNNYTTTHEIPKSLLNWGEAQGDAVRFSRKTKMYFNKPQLWLDQGFMYIEDDTTLMMSKMFLTRCPIRIIKYVLESEL